MSGILYTIANTGQLIKVKYLQVKYDWVLTAANEVRQCDSFAAELKEVEVPREYVSLHRWIPCGRMLIYYASSESHTHQMRQITCS